MLKMGTPVKIKSAVRRSAMSEWSWQSLQGQLLAAQANPLNPHQLWKAQTFPEKCVAD